MLIGLNDICTGSPKYSSISKHGVELFSFIYRNDEGFEKQFLIEMKIKYGIFYYLFLL